MTFFEEIAEQLSNFFGFLGSYEDIGVMFTTGWNNFVGFLEAFWTQITNLFS